MKSKNISKVLAVLLVITMCLQLLPVAVFASGEPVVELEITDETGEADKSADTTVAEEVYGGETEGSADISSEEPIIDDSMQIQIMGEGDTADYVDTNGNTYSYIIDGEGNATITGFTRVGPAAIEIPGAIDEITVTKIGNTAFRSKGLTSVLIPDSITEIGAEAFSWNQLASVTIPEGVISIGNQAFEYNHDTLSSITLGSSLESIGNKAFYNDKLVSVTIPDSVKSIGNDAFSGGSNVIESVTLGSGLLSIGDSAFNSQKIQTLIIPGNVESVGAYCFAYNKITEVTVENRDLVIGVLAFGNQVEVPSFTIYGHDPSSAKTYAETWEHSFIALEDGGEDGSDEPMVLIHDEPLTHGFPGDREYISVKAVLPEGMSIEDVEVKLHYTIVDTGESEDDPYVTTDETEMWYDEDEDMFYGSIWMPWSGYVYYGFSAYFNNGESSAYTYLPELLSDKGYDYKELYEVEVGYEELHPEEVRITPSTLNLNLNGPRGVVSAQVIPWEVEDNSVTWRSTDESVAVFEDGMVVPVGEGTCQIIARTNDGGIEGACDVTVGPETSAPYMKLQSYSFENDTTYKSIAYNDGVYVVVSDAGQIFKSTDLETFNLVHGQEYDGIYEEVKYINDRFIAVGYTPDGKDFSGWMSISTDNGDTWTDSSNFSKELFDVIYTEEGKYVAIGRYKQYVSDDAESWEEQDLPLAAAGWEWIGKKLVCANGKYYAIGNDQVHPVIFVSDNCIDWTQMELPEVFQGEYIYGFNAATVVNDEIIVGGSKGYMAKSTDGETWTQLSIPGIEDNISVLDLVYAEGKYVIVGNGWDDDQVYLFESADGENWSPILVEGSLQIASVIPMESGHVGVGEYSSVYKLNTPSGNPPEEEKSTNNSLSSLSISGVTINPIFASGTLSYTASAANNTSTATVTPILSDNKASVRINGQPLSNGSRSVALNVGSNTISIVVTSESGVQKTYTVTITRAAAEIQPSGSTGRDDDRDTITQPPATVPSPSNNSASIALNGETQSNTAAVKTEVNSTGQTTTTVTIDEKKLGEILNKLPVASNSNGTESQNPPTITIPAAGNADVVVGVLNGQMVKDMENKAVVLEIKTETASYTLPAQQIDISAVSQSIGQDVKLTDIKVQIEIAKPNDAVVKVVEDSAKKGNFTLVVPPVEFNITCTYGNKTVEVSQFNNYVERTVAIPEGVDPSKITTGVVISTDGTVRHVPTKIIIIDGKYYAQINSLTNSTYSVVWNPIEFKDVANHWAKEAINDMGSRMIISGVGDGMFEPDKDITRAEFAAIIVKALGLKPGTGKLSFSDVKSTDWYNSYVITAAEYKIISGYGNGKFGPTDKITHEQAMTMIARAMSLTGLKVEFSSGEVEKLLADNLDVEASAGYAKEGIASCIKLGIVAEINEKHIAPRDNITRAEVATFVRLLLQKSNLI